MDVKRKIYAVELITQKIKNSLTAEGEEIAEEVAFHFIDWINDFRQLSSFYENPEDYDLETIERVIFNFASHVAYHIPEAKKLLRSGRLKSSHS